MNEELEKIKIILSDKIWLKIKDDLHKREVGLKDILTQPGDIEDFGLSTEKLKEELEKCDKLKEALSPENWGNKVGAEELSKRLDEFYFHEDDKLRRLYKSYYF